MRLRKPTRNELKEIEERKAAMRSFRPRNIAEAATQLPVGGYDIIDIVFAQVNCEEDVPEKTDYVIRAKDYVKYMGLKRNEDAYEKLENACTTMTKEDGFYIYGKDNIKTFYHWITKIIFDKDHKEITVSLHPEVKQMLVEAKNSKEAIIFYNLKHILPLKSPYSKRIYYMCKEWEKTGHRYDNLDMLREKLVVPEYCDKYTVFRIRVLEVAVSEINEKTDLNISFSEVMEKGNGGMRVTGLNWAIEKNTEGEKDKNVPAEA